MFPLAACNRLLLSFPFFLQIQINSKECNAFVCYGVLLMYHHQLAIITAIEIIIITHIMLKKPLHLNGKNGMHIRQQIEVPSLSLSVYKQSCLNLSKLIRAKVNCQQTSLVLLQPATGEHSVIM